MKLTNKAYRVWKILLDYPNEWLDVSEIAYETNLTHRQVTSIINMMPSPPVYREEVPRDRSRKVIYKGTAHEAEELRKALYSECHEITQNKKDKVYCALSPIGWQTIADLEAATGYTALEITRILSVLDGVFVKDTDSAMLYRRM